MLTEKEIEVLNLMDKGFTQKEIALKLNITQPAVSGLYRNAIRKISEAYEIIQITKKFKRLSKLNYNIFNKSKRG